MLLKLYAVGQACGEWWGVNRELTVGLHRKEKAEANTMKSGPEKACRRQHVPPKRRKHLPQPYGGTTQEQTQHQESSTAITEELKSFYRMYRLVQGVTIYRLPKTKCYE
jgi:hypothetical protein